MHGKKYVWILYLPKALYLTIPFFIQVWLISCGCGLMLPKGGIARV